MLYVRRFGTGMEVVALHGFSHTGEQFCPMAGPLGRAVIAPDLPGHGVSAVEPTGIASVTTAVTDLLEASHGTLPVIGYSQGGRLALLAALEMPSAFSSLVLVSATAGIRGREARRERRISDARLAEQIESDGATAFIDEWTGSGLTSTRHLTAEHRAWDRSVREVNTAGGLAAALIGYGQGAQPDVWDRLGELTIPVLLIAGSSDTRYVGIAEEMEERITHAELSVVGRAGHNPLADRPVATFTAISRFLDRQR